MTLSSISRDQVDEDGMEMEHQSQRQLRQNRADSGNTESGPRQSFFAVPDMPTETTDLGKISASESPDLATQTTDLGKISAAEGSEQSAETPLLVDSRDIHLESSDAEVTDAEEEEDDGVPYDRGWAWVVVFGMFVNFLLLSGYLKSSGLFFVELLRKFNAPATHTALLFAIRAGIFSISGMYVMNVFLARFGSRTLVLLGGACMALSAILSSVANQLTLLICIHSLLLAMGMAMLISPGEVLVGHYFKKRRSLALSLAKCGASIGNIVVPPLMTYLLEEYGLNGTLLLYGGMCLNSLAAALLLRPTSFFVKRRQRQHQLRLAQHGDDGGAASGDREAPKSSENGSGAVKSLSQNGVKDQNGVQISPAISEAVESKPVARKAKSDVRPHTSAIVSIQITEVSSDSRLNPRKPETKPPLQIHSRSEMTSSRHFDTLEGDLAALAKSNPELKFVPATRGSFRKRTFSEPAERHDQTSKVARQMSDVEKRVGSDILEAISQSSMVMYMSMSSIDIASASMLPGLPLDTRRQRENAGSTKSLDSGLGKDQEGKSLDTASFSCTHIVKCVLQCPKKAVSMLDFSLLKSPVFRLLLLYFVVSPFVNITLDYLPALASENGVTESQAALLLSIIGGLDLVCRLSSGFIADLKILRVPTLISISFVTLAVVTQFVRFMSSFEHFVILAALQGLFGGVANCLAPVLVIEFVGLKNMGKGIGFCQLTSGASMAAVYPTLGFIRDITGSYAVVYHVIGCGLLVAAALLCCEGVVRRMEARKQNQDLDYAKPEPEIVVESKNKR